MIAACLLASHGFPLLSSEKKVHKTRHCACVACVCSMCQWARVCSPRVQALALSVKSITPSVRYLYCRLQLTRSRSITRFKAQLRTWQSSMSSPRFCFFPFFLIFFHLFSLFSPATVKHFFTRFRAFFRLHQSNGYTNKAPVSGTKCRENLVSLACFTVAEDERKKVLL